MAGAERYVAQVAHQGALVALLDVRVGPVAAAHALQEVQLVRLVAAGAVVARQLLPVHPQDAVAAVVYQHGPLVAVERDAELRPLEPARVPAPSLPGDPLIAVVVGHYQRVRRLL